MQAVNGPAANGDPLPGLGSETHNNLYDAQERLLYTRSRSTDDQGNLNDKCRVDYTAPGSYDAADNLKQYVMTDASGMVNTYHYTLAEYDGYRKISPEFPTGGPASYMVQYGDMLRSIAQTASIA